MEPDKCWEKNLILSYICPNVSLYRFINHIGIDLEGKFVLDLGCGRGQELYEMGRRGAKSYGVDINQKTVDNIIKHRNGKYPIMWLNDISTDLSRYGCKFDLIFSLDTLYYLEDLDGCLGGIKKCLLPEGKFIFQVITGDYFRGKFSPKAILKDSGNPIIFRDREYYINALKKNDFDVIAEKTVKETFFTARDAERHNLYICCE